MEKLLLCFLFITLLGTQLDAQIKINWQDLADVEFKAKYFEEHDMQFLAPVFGERPKKFEGKEVVIKGYAIPLDEAGQIYALSLYPYSSCFFCGAAGPETVIELNLKPSAKKRYKMDEVTSFKGILQLNDDDVEHFNYILNDASPVE